MIKQVLFAVFLLSSALLSADSCPVLQRESSITSSGSLGALEDSAFEQIMREIEALTAPINKGQK